MPPTQTHTNNIESDINTPGTHSDSEVVFIIYIIECKNIRY